MSLWQAARDLYRNLGPLSVSLFQGCQNSGNVGPLEFYIPQADRPVKVLMTVLELTPGEPTGMADNHRTQLSHCYRATVGILRSSPGLASRRRVAARLQEVLKALPQATLPVLCNVRQATWGRLCVTNTHRVGLCRCSCGLLQIH